MLDLREEREKKGMTQQALAEKVGVTRAHISMIEGGQVHASVKTAKAIGKALGIDWARFFEEDE